MVFWGLGEGVGCSSLLFEGICYSSCCLFLFTFVQREAKMLFWCDDLEKDVICRLGLQSGWG